MNLKELSALLGLSQTTVSRALNGFPEVNETTRLRVAEAARQHHYKPNPRARGLATGRAMAIGHVIPVSGPQVMDPAFSEFIAGAGEVCAATDHEMILSFVPEAEEAETYRKLCARGTVDGVILHAPKVDDPRIALLNDIGLPFVVHGRSAGAVLPYSWLDLNNKRAFRFAVGFLLDLGHRRIALINGPEVLDFAHARRLGYEKALAAAKVPVDPALMYSGELTEAYGHRCTEELLRRPEPPTAIFTSALLPAIGARRAVDEAGLKIGRDISLVTHDDDLSCLGSSDATPVFTATRFPVREAGRLAAQMLVEAMADRSKPPQGRLLRATLVVGTSTGPAPGQRVIPQ